MAIAKAISGNLVHPAGYGSYCNGNDKNITIPAPPSSQTYLNSSSVPNPGGDFSYLTGNYMNVPAVHFVMAEGPGGMPPVEEDLTAPAPVAVEAPAKETVAKKDKDDK